MLKVDGIKLPIDHSEEDIHEKIEKILKLDRVFKDDSRLHYSFRIIRKSLDARRKPELFYVYSLAVDVDKFVEDKILRHNRDRSISLYSPVIYEPPGDRGTETLTERPVIVGAGPAGLFCAYELSRLGYCPIVIERGEEVDDRIETVKDFLKNRVLDPDSNVQFGEGGAGTFSDGKLNTGVKDKMGRNQYVLDTLVDFGAQDEISYVAKPHIGTDVLASVVRNMRNAVIEKGGEFRFKTRFISFESGPDGMRSLKVICSNKTEEIKTNCLILAIGHSARDTFTMLKDAGVEMTAKAFAVGLRIQHPQAMINKSQYGQEHVEGLGAADYKLTNRTGDGRNVYSFCMCPGGYVINASSEEGMLAVNGMSYRNRDSLNANSAIIVSIDKDDYGEGVLAGMEFQRKLEKKAYELGKGLIPIQEYGDFKENKTDLEAGQVIPQIKGGYQLANLRDLLPENINKAIIESIDKFGYTIEGFDRKDAILAGVESRTSSPVRILRDDDLVSNIKGLYPCGEGAGYAGGITSAAMDGIKVAEAVVKKFAPVKKEDKI